jgi:soluble lytic murein transglycosylase-like protein
VERLLIILAAFGAFFYSAETQSKKSAKEETGPVGVTNQSLDDIYKSVGFQYGVDWKLIKSHAIIESSERPNAKNAADPSYGLMQILCTPDGNGGCKNRFNIQDWPPKSTDELYDPVYNVRLGAQIIRWNQDTYGLKQGIAVYNNWGARNDNYNGPYRNQGYVDKVLSEYRKLGGKEPE